MNEMDWSFIKSPRFYGNFFISLGAWLQMPNPLTLAAFGVFMIAFGGLFVTTGTIDRIADKALAGKTMSTVATASTTTTEAPKGTTTTASTTTESTTSDGTLNGSNEPVG